MKISSPSGTTICVSCVKETATKLGREKCRAFSPRRVRDVEKKVIEEEN